MLNNPAWSLPSETWKASAYEYRTAREKAEGLRARDSETTEAIGQADGASDSPGAPTGLGKAAPNKQARKAKV